MRYAAIAAAVGAIAVTWTGSALRSEAATRPLFSLHASPGGFSSEQRLTVYGDGTAVVESGREPALRLRLPRPAVRQLRTLFKQLHFRSLKSSYAPASATDQPTYDVTFGARTVRTESGSPPAPTRLWTLIGQLEGVIREARDPFVVDLWVRADGLRLTLMGDHSALIDTGSGPRTRHLTTACFRRLRAATRGLRTRKLTPGIIPITFRNPPPTVEVTRAFSSFHTRVRKRMPRSAAELVASARAAAGPDCS